MRAVFGALFPLMFLSAIGLVACSGTRSGDVGGTEDRIGATSIVAGGVEFRYRDPSAERVYLVGDFNAWMPRLDPMKDADGDGVWTLFYPLPPGRYEYKFVVDGRWLSDRRNPAWAPDGFGDRNSVVSIPRAPESGD